MAKAKQAEFVQWMGPVLDVLRDPGGLGTPKEVSSAIADKLNIPESKPEEKLKSGTPRFHNRVCWARQYLVWDGYLVNFRVLFQCKRYSEKNSVSRVQIADFRNAMIGRADKGIFITTSYFTKDAEREASREGAPPIELVDGNKLVDMIEKSELGLKPVVALEVDLDFFEGYMG